MSAIVVVDDLTTNRRILSQLAKSIEPAVDVHDFACPLEALAWLGEYPADLVVTDFRMPSMNGDELIRRIRALPGGAQVPIIAVTVNEDRDYRYRALDAGATDFLVSPIDHKEFRARAKNLLELHRLKQLVDRRARSLEHRLHRVIDTVPAMISATDGNGRTIFVNNYLSQFFGVEPRAAEGRPMVELLGGPSGTTHETADRHIRDGEIPATAFEESHADRSGARRDFLTVKAPLQEDGDRAAGVVTVSLDITTLKRRERELLEKSALLEGIFRDVPDALVVIGADGAVVMANDGAASMFGYDAQSLTGLSAPALFEDGADYVKLRRDVEKAGHGREQAPVVLKCRRRDGSVFLGETVATAISCESGEIFGQVFLIRDVTLRQLEEERRRQSQKLEALGQMAGGIAHEFNNMLTTIIGFTQMAMRRPDDTARVSDCLKEISEASSRAADLTRDMLTFSHKQVLEPRVVRAGDEIRAVEKLVGAGVEDSIELQIDVSDEEARVRVDPAQLSQCLVNLVNNARHAMPKGGTLVVRCGTEQLSRPLATSHGDRLQSGHYVRIDVADTGTGIEPAVFERIFDPYFTTKEKGIGTGLGLSLAYGMIRNAGGVIHVHSRVGAGTVFSIYLPAVEAEPAASAKGEIEVAEVVATDAFETILLAEDDEQLRDFAQRALEDRGYRVIAAPDGAEAIALFERHAGEIDLLLTDVMMPRVGGVDLVRHVRAQRPHLRCIYMSGYAPDLTDQVAGVGEAIPFLRKPFGPDLLYRTIRETLHRDGRQDKQGPTTAGCEPGGRME